MPQFVYRLQPARLDMVNAPTAEETQIISEHFAYLQAACEAGTVLMAGRTTELPDIWGVVILEAEDEAAARAFMDNDPGVKGGVQLATLYPFRVALWREKLGL